MNDTRIKTKTLTGLALFTAIVIVLQLLGSFIRFGPFSISLVLIPIVVGVHLEHSNIQWFLHLQASAQQVPNRLGQK